MTPNLRYRRLAALGLPVVLLLLSACSTSGYPNTTFERSTEFNTAVDELWDLLLLLGTIVFVLVEAWLIYTIVRYRRRDDNRPEQVHGNTTLEIAWTVIPAVILAIIAVPTVRTIFETQGKAKSGALQVEVIGHQWWWEFRYPELGVVTANELYLPTGRTVNFALKTKDVLHSFWIPRLGGKRDLISNHTNYLWFTPDSAFAVNGQCAEYCGASHADMRLRVITLPPDQFEAWVAHQKTPAAGSAQLAAATPAGAGPTTVAQASVAPAVPGAAITPVGAAPAPVWNGPGQLPDYFIPKTPIPAGLEMPQGMVGDVERGRQAYSTTSCIGCHAIQGNPASISTIGPNLTHVGSRATIAAGLYPNDQRHMFAWIKNARLMKPGVIMPTIGQGQYDPVMKATARAGTLTDQQIADITAYLLSLK
jgi:cytochrome c oxidase subunit II